MDLDLVFEIAGYIAAFLVFCTFYTKTMIPLRMIAIGSNLAFITYGFLGGLWPVLILHVTLFPLNIVRLTQMLRLIDEAKKASTENFSVDWLFPYMKEEKYSKGETIFKMADDAENMYVITKGEIELVEIGVIVKKGDILGEMGVFAPEKKRTASAVCLTDVVLRSLTAEKALELYFQNPNFGFFLIKLITYRLLENAKYARPHLETALPHHTDDE